MTFYHCRIWAWRKNSDGYGLIRYAGRQYFAHRVVWQAFHGPIPAGKLVLHKCDHPGCFNPNHLFLGTYTDNNKDRMNKKRSAVGERAGRVKLSDAKVKAIRALYPTGQYTTTELGKTYGVSNHQISMIVRRRSWRHI